MLTGPHLYFNRSILRWMVRTSLDYRTEFVSNLVKTKGLTIATAEIVDILHSKIRADFAEEIRDGVFKSISYDMNILTKVIQEYIKESIIG